MLSGRHFRTGVRFPPPPLLRPIRTALRGLIEQIEDLEGGAHEPGAGGDGLTSDNFPRWSLLVRQAKPGRPALFRARTLSGRQLGEIIQRSIASVNFAGLPCLSPPSELRRSRRRPRPTRHQRGHAVSLPWRERNGVLAGVGGLHAEHRRP